MSQAGCLEDLLMAALMRSSSASPSTWLDSRGFHSSLTEPQGCKLDLLLLDRHAARHHMQVLQYSPPPPPPHHHLQSSFSPPEGHLCHNNDLLTADIKPTMFQEWHKEDLPVAALRTFAIPFRQDVPPTQHFLPCALDDCWLKYTLCPSIIQVCVLVHNLQIYVSQWHEHKRCMRYARMPRELSSKPCNIVFQQ